MLEAVVGTSVMAAAPAAVLVHRAWRRQQGMKPLALTAPEAICEEGYVRLGGLEQWVSVRGEGRLNPVMLELHGGPGAPNTIFTPRTRAWERYLTVVRWEMRGAGRTLARSGAAAQGTLSVDQLASDAIELAEHLRARTGQARVILMGHSFGSVIALRVLRRRPDLFSAYVGTDQNVREGSGEVHGFAAALNTLRASGKRKDLAVLERMGADSRRWTADDWANSARLIANADPTLSGVMRTVVMASLWFSPIHGLRDLAGYAKGLAFSKPLFLEAAAMDMRSEGVRFEVPFFVFQGEHDVVTPPDAARRFVDDVVAPVKAFELIPGGSHFAPFSHPDAFLKLLQRHVLPIASRPS